MYADDTQVYLSFNRNNSHSLLEKIEHCITEIRKWMKDNFLKLNDSKTEFLVLNSRRMKPVDENCIVFGDESVGAVKSARNIGAILDKLGVAVRTGHHCAQPIMNFYNIPGTVRASFAFYNTKEEIDILVTAVKKAATMLS